MNKSAGSDPRVGILKAISSWESVAFDLDQLLQLIIETSTNVMNAKASSLLLLDNKTKKLYFKIATGEKKEEIKKYEINVGEGIAGYVAETGEPLLIPDVAKDERWDKKISESIGFQTRSIACVPMKTNGAVIGVVEIIDREDGRPIQEEDLEILTSFADLASKAIDNARRFNAVKKENKNLKEELSNRYEIIGESESIRKVIGDAYKVANSKASTLIVGESGTGKELLARLIHRAGPRKDKPLVVINCGALPETLLEAELFGYEKGSFTGAVAKKIGMFEMADEGSVFLDEVGEMSPTMQVKLLRVLQEGIFYRIGGQNPISVDVRVISATNKDIVREVSEGRFREDLYYRLNVVQIHMPALRERRDDISLLVEHFLNIFKKERGTMDLKISPAAMEEIVQHDWPGNVRELENAIERGVVMGNGKEILPEDLPIQTSSTDYGNDIQVGMSLKNAVDHFKKEFIIMTLNSTGGNKSKAAKVLDVQRTYLSRLVSKYNLN
ncbi:MAG: sigma 54-interacting transcriptional regulator [Deltaproteobacteria bacterium]|nr:sigma 54-interacting transcriptional regulator [Deltaproteobacteria bacterium]